MENNKSTKWIQKGAVSQLVEVVETDLGQFGDREAAQATASYRSSEFDDAVVIRDRVYGWRAVGQTWGRIIREVA